ncbi:MAG: hypothetical protein K0A99_02970 [Desulfoarculaceae bacterium]|nr:hypothetical protein [Desulfoarculaceae bacterium]
MKTRIVKVSVTSSLLLVVILLTATLDLASAAVTHVAATRGTAEPPFLSLGIKSNLLMLLDNSGSMLDMAHVDEESNCNDSPDSARGYIGYNSANPYAGYFEENEWYSWSNGITLWAPSTTYNHLALVYDNGIVYQAECVEKADGNGNSVVQETCVSDTTASEITEDDTEISWTAKPGVRVWKSGQSYNQGDFCRFGSQLYYALNNVSGTVDPLTDAAHWQSVEHTWRPDTAYSAHDVVSYQGMIFVLNASKSLAANRSSQSIWEDNDGGFPWNRVDEGSFSQVSDGSECVGTDYATSSGDLCIKVDETSTPKGVVKFSAKGKVLNWLSASKFDIQKDILTGGKYSPETQLLIAENRGCAGSGFIKGINVVSGSTTKVLSFRIGGPEKDNPLEGRNDWVDTLDNTTRIEVLGITDGPLLSGDCQDAIDGMLAGANLQSLSNKISGCLSPQKDAEDPELGDQRPFLNHALQACQEFMDGSDRNLNTIIGECENLYTAKTSSKNAYLPWEISPYYGAYACYGVYDAGVYHQDRTGFIGRCWDTGGGTVGCNLKPAVIPVPSLVCPVAGCSVPASTWLSGANLRRNNNGRVEECTDTVEKKGVYSCKKVTDWAPVYVDGATNEYVNDATCGGTPAVAAWNPPDPKANISCNDPEDPANCVDYEQCVFQGMWDYCKSLSVPEVIDPSDQASTTTDLWNAPATLIDSGVIAATGTDRPLAVMKGYIKQDIPPKGILQSTAGELRIGAMAFNDNGAGSASECGGDDVPPQIEQFCSGSKKDGAQVISEIMLGSTVTDTTNNRTHVDDLAGAINDVRATSWTPLAEAMYNAIGYYTQNTDMRLNTDDFPVGDGHDPVTNWCQSNNILVITEGASTADINSQVENFVRETAIDDNDTEIGTCPNGLYGSTYLDDLTNHAQHAAASELYPEGNRQLQTLDGELKDKQNITTYVVASGGLRGSVDGDECTPAALISNAAANGGTTLYDSASPEQLEEDLLAIFNALRQRASSGSAASVISSSRGGEGAIYQAIFWPEIKRMDAGGKEHSVAWTGDVHALFVDSRGYMYEDTNGDRAMTSSDQRLVIYFDEVSGKSKACYNTENWLGTCPDTPVDIQDVKFIWSAGEWLSDPFLDTSVNRPTYISNAKQRYIYTWNDLNNDGIVDRATEWLPFQARTDWHSLAGTGRSSVPVDFDVVTADVASNTTAQNAKVNDIVNWVRGRDRLTAANLNGIVGTTDDGEAPLRSRQLPASEGVSTMVTARLGDIIHSTPMTVSSPAEGFHLIYNDFSYAEFVKKYKKRRHVIYFGSNDGMLHAVNGGFYDENDKKFCLTVDCQGEDGSVPALGAELWAYVPYNLLPHLSSLTNPDYAHKYYVDLRPRIFDVQIFPTGVDSHGIDHPNGWGTILVGGMRLGGAPINASELHNPSAGDDRQFISSYFIFDITNPELPPVLLGEMTRTTQQQDGVDVDTDLGHSLAIPTMVIMKDKTEPQTAEKNQWYLVFGSGPHAEIGSNAAMKGISDQNARLAVLPLDWLVKSPTALRIPAEPPSEGSKYGGTIELGDSPKGFTSDLITIDGDINPSSTSYMADAVYFGTNEGDYAEGFRGRIYRLMTRNKISGEYLFGTNITQQITTPDPVQWKVSTLMDVGQPVNAAPSVGYDGSNFWLYVGTGRFFDADDRTEATQQSFYGIKEPMERIQPVSGNPYMKFLGDKVVAPIAAAHGDTSAARIWPDETATPGNKGLLKVDEIRVAQAATPSLAFLSCRDSNTLDCIPSSMVSAEKTTLADLTSYIAGPEPTTDPDNLYNSADGWYVDYFPYGNRESNLGQATLFGGLVTFTTYQPFLDPCQAEGKAFLYTLYYQTGTAWHKAIFGDHGLYNDGTTVREKMDLGRGLSTTPNLHVSGDGDSVTAMVQTSTGVIVEQKMDEMATGDYFTGRTGWKECTE